MPFLRALLALLMIRAAAGAAEPGPIGEAFRQEWKLAPFYAKVLDAGIPVVGSARVSDMAIAEAGWIVGRMLDGRDDILRAMRANRVRLVVMAAGEYTTDIPEHAGLKPPLFWDRRARGLGATLANPAVSCGEENLLAFPGDPYPGENILVHEFAHAIHGTGMVTVDPGFDARLKAAHRAAVDRGLWRGTYAETDSGEYWAEGVQCWFDDNAPADALHNGIRTRAALTRHDPTLAALCRGVFGDKPWRYARPAARPAAETAHLRGYDPSRLPRFRWREAPLTPRPRVLVQTSEGDMELELETDAAREAVSLFLAVALAGGYHGARLQADSAGARASPLASRLEGVALPGKGRELPASSLRPGSAAVAMVRGAPGDFLITGDTAAAEAPGLAPVGRIVKGAETAGKIMRAVAAGPGRGVDIRRVIRTE